MVTVMMGKRTAFRMAWHRELNKPGMLQRVRTGLVLAQTADRHPRPVKHTGATYWQAKASSDSVEILGAAASLRKLH